MRKESTTIQKCNSRLTALGLNSDAAFHRSKLILKIYRDVVWVLSERAEELQETLAIIEGNAGPMNQVLTLQEVNAIIVPLEGPPHGQHP